MNCVVCNDEKTQRHHLFPKRFYGQSIRVCLCDKHHKEVEFLIWVMETKSGERKRKKLHDQQYLDVIFTVQRRNHEKHRDEN